MTGRVVFRSIVLVLSIASLAGCVVYETATPPPVSRPVPPPAPAPAPRPVAVGIDFFYGALDPDGDWLWIEPHGWVWAPNAVDPFWRPYTVGRWAWTDWGWTWVSAERWGWATYHYGRWVRIHRHGWVWVPGDVWGPAWVAWRHGVGVVGWAPLPPEVRFRAGFGLDWGGIDIDIAIRLDTWCFLDDVRFVEPDVHRHAYPVGRNATVIRATRDATKVRVIDKRIFNEGIDHDEIERANRRPIPKRRVVDLGSADRRTPEVAGDEIRVYRPEVRPEPPKGAPPRGRRTPEPGAPRAAAPAPAKTEQEAERRWDKGWNEDWRKLEAEQKRARPPAPGAKPPAAPAPKPPPPPEVGKEEREENYTAAENAYRELQAERERAKRRADRGPKKTPPAKKDADK